MSAHCASNSAMSIASTLTPFYFGTSRMASLHIGISKDNKSKFIPVTGCDNLQGCEMSRILHFSDNQFANGGGVFTSKLAMPYQPPTPTYFLVFISVTG
jgi:hypothetical protein